MEKENDCLNIKRGYLKGDFEYFHLKDKKSMEFEFHYHDFNKIIIFVSGTVTYLIEGKSYKLRPWDLLFICDNDVHKPIISPEEPYERIIIWVNSRFLEMHNNKNGDLLTCFNLAHKEKINLLRLSSEGIKSIKDTLFLLEDAVKNISFGSEVLKNALFLQLMVYLNRLYLGTKIVKTDSDVQYDERIAEILDYINKNLNENLSIDSIALKFYMNKYYLMHKFKSETGYTIHNYIQQKRLMLAAALIRKGRQITEVHIECGFGDYSSFVRAFKKTFELSPKKYYSTMVELEKSYNNSKHMFVK